MSNPQGIVPCPSCGWGVSVTAKRCPKCGGTISVSGLLWAHNPMLATVLLLVCSGFLWFACSSIGR